MNKNMAILAGIVGFMTILMSVYDFGNKIYSLFETGSIVSKTCIITLIVAIIAYFFQYFKMISHVTEIMKLIDEAKKSILSAAKEYTDTKYDKIERDMEYLKEKVDSNNDVLERISDQIFKLANNSKPKD